MLHRRLWVLVISMAVLAVPGIGEAAKKPVKVAVTDQAQARIETDSDSSQSYAKILGAGVILGDPIGINGKYWLDHTQALSASVGSSLGPGRLAFYGDYLYHFYPFDEAPELPLYVGGGAFLGGSQGYFWTGIRGALGVSYIFQEPVDVFMEIYPRFIFSPNAGFDMTLSIGARVYFNIRQ